MLAAWPGGILIAIAGESVQILNIAYLPACIIIFVGGVVCINKCKKRKNKVAKRISNILSTQEMSKIISCMTKNMILHSMLKCKIKKA